MSQPVPSSMPASLLACLIFLFLLPSFISGSCLHTLPSNKSIQIINPFYFQLDNNTFDPNCTGFLGIGCNNERPTFYWRELLPLESISYNTNTIRVSDLNLSNSVKESGCDQIQSPPEIFGKDYSYNLSYSPSHNEGDATQKDCSRPDDSVPTFELMLLFCNNSPALSLQSASYSYNLAERPGCFTNSTEVFDCTGGCKDSGTNYSSRTSQARRNKIFIDFATTSDDQNMSLNAQHLLVAADRYGLERLRLMCEDILCQNLDVGTVTTALILAEKHNCDQLKAECLKFMSSTEVFKAVTLTPEFSDLMKICPSIVMDFKALYLK